MEIKIICSIFIKMFYFRPDKDFKLVMSIRGSYAPDPIIYLNLENK